MSDLIAVPVADTVELREQIIRSCLYLRDHLGYFFGTWGNISVRIQDGLLLTPSRVSYDSLKTEDLVVVSMEGRVIKGHRMPTSEMLLHLLLMKSRPDFGAIVHSHSPYAATVSCCHKEIPVLVDDMAEIVGGPVNCSAYVSAGEHKEMAISAQAAIHPESFAVLLGNHGSVAAGRDLQEAIVCSQCVERAAMIFLQSQNLGGAIAIPEKLWKQERHRYLFKYGTKADFAGVDLK